MKKFLIIFLLLFSITSFAQITTNLPVKNISKLDSIRFKDSVIVTKDNIYLLGSNVKLVSADFSLINKGKYYSTIQKAIDSSSSGTTIIVYPGSYTINNLTAKNGVNIVFLEGASVISTNTKAINIPDNVNCSIYGLDLQFQHNTETANLRSAVSFGKKDTVSINFSGITCRVDGDGEIYDKDSTGFFFFKDSCQIDISVDDFNFNRPAAITNEIGRIVNSTASTGNFNLKVGRMNFINDGVDINFICKNDTKILIEDIVADRPSYNLLSFIAKDNSLNDIKVNCKYSNFTMNLGISNNSTTKLNAKNFSNIVTSNNSILTLNADRVQGITTNGKSKVNFIGSYIGDGGLTCNDTSYLYVKCDTLDYFATSNNYSTLNIESKVITQLVSSGSHSYMSVKAYKMNGVSNNSDKEQTIDAYKTGDVYSGLGKQKIVATNVGTVQIVEGEQNIKADSIGTISCMGGGVQTISANVINRFIENRAGGTQYITTNKIDNFLGGVNVFSDASGLIFLNAKELKNKDDVFNSQGIFTIAGTSRLFANVDKVTTSSNTLQLSGKGFAQININYCEMKNDSGHVLRIVDTSVAYVKIGKVKNNSSYSSVYLLNAGKLYADFLDTLSAGNAPAIEINTGCFANIKAKNILNNGTGASAQTMILYGNGVVEADLIQNLADSMAVIDSQSSNFLVKARIKGDNIIGGIVAIGGTGDGLVLDECKIINLSAGNSIKSYSGSRSVYVYNLFSTVAKDGNITLLVGSETVSSNVR